MYSDDESDSESEFYSPEEMGNTEIYNEGEFFNPESNKENNGVVNENNILSTRAWTIFSILLKLNVLKTLQRKRITTSVFGTGTVKLQKKYES